MSGKSRPAAWFGFSVNNDLLALLIVLATFALALAAAYLPGAL